MEFLLELLKLTLPGLLVFLAAYYVLKTYLDSQLRREEIKLQRERREATLPLKLQAYERLSMFCERITLPNLLLRVRQEEMTAGALRLGMLLDLQQEYEHNITQQVYVSTQLWEIIKIARDESIDLISIAAQEVSKDAKGQELAQQIFKLLNEREALVVEKALLAIKKEAAHHLS